MSRRKWGFRNVRRPEQLETRAMLAAGGFMPFAFGAHHGGDGLGQQAATQFVSSAIAGRLTGNEQGSASCGSYSDSDETSFTATLTDSSGTATGTATYSTQTFEGEVETTFSVTVAAATADTTFDVTVGDTVVGQLTTDDTGAGSLVLSSNPTGTEQELPADFPSNIGADTAITVGTLSGSLVADTSTGNGEGEGHGSGCHGDSSVDTSLEASLTDLDTTSTATGTASYQVDNESGTTTFSVSVSGATASSTLDVAIDDTVVGQLTTDETGAGSLVLSSDPSDTEQALPLDFPTNLSAGSTVTVGTLTGTLALANSGTTDSYVRALHFGRHR
jgi:hypothetical protein